METIIFFKNFFSNIDVADFVGLLYEHVYNLCNYAFNYCPLHYQMLYFYFPILFLILQKFRSEENNYNSTCTNYIFVKLVFFFKKLKNINILFQYTNTFFKKLFLFVKIIFLKKFGSHCAVLFTFIKKNHF